VREIVRQSARGGHQAPEGNCPGHDPLAWPPVYQSGHRNAREHVEKHEGKADQQADLGVTEPEVSLDRGDEQGHQLPV